MNAGEKVLQPGVHRGMRCVEVNTGRRLWLASLPDRASQTGNQRCLQSEAREVYMWQEVHVKVAVLYCN